MRARAEKPKRASAAAGAASAPRPSLDGGLPLFPLFFPSLRPSSRTRSSSVASCAFSDAFSAASAAARELSGMTPVNPNCLKSRLKPSHWSNLNQTEHRMSAAFTQMGPHQVAEHLPHGFKVRTG